MTNAKQNTPVMIFVEKLREQIKGHLSTRPAWGYRQALKEIDDAIFETLKFYERGDHGKKS